jgi:hypothetical protein
VIAGGASVGRACCNPIGLGGHRGAEGASEQAPVQVEEVAGQQKALASKLPVEAANLVPVQADDLATV